MARLGETSRRLINHLTTVMSATLRSCLDVTFKITKSLSTYQCEIWTARPLDTAHNDDDKKKTL